jgi:hypothetical protein
VTLTLKEAEATLEPKDAGALKTKQKISECIELLNYRQNLVNMAASSEHGWKAVKTLLHLQFVAPKIPTPSLQY